MNGLEDKNELSDFRTDKTETVEVDSTGIRTESAGVCRSRSGDDFGKADRTDADPGTDRSGRTEGKTPVGDVSGRRTGRLPH